MKKQLLAVTALCLILSACASQTPEEKRMTQEIETKAPAVPPLESSIPESELSPSVSPGETTSAAAPSSDYYVIKASIDASELDMEILEAEYRIGALKADSFDTQKTSLKTQKEELEALKRGLTEPVFDSADMEDLTLLDMNTLMVKLEEYDSQEDRLEREEDRLEASYLAEELTREQFIAEQTKLLYEDDILDSQKDRVEDYLEKLGWVD